MPRSGQPKHKVSRRFGMDIYGTGGESLQRRLGSAGGQQRGGAGGARGGRRRRPSDFAIQLQEKQKAKAIYGVAEGQFRRYFERAARRPGPTGDNLLQLLERRLDNVVYALGFARTRPMARQMVNHGHVLVDGQRVDIPSFLVEPGQSIALTESTARLPAVVEELAANRPVPRWLERQGATGRVLSLPARDDLALPIDEQLIVAYYAR